MQKVFSSIVIATLVVLPYVSSAQLSSENYRVEGHAIGSAGQSADATSTNFGLDQESGGLYEYGGPDAEEPDTGDGGGSGGSRPRPPRQGDEAVLGKLDSITICHAGGSDRYVALANVQVFITLAESGLQTELRGHDGHSEDIVPAFKYDLGDGVKTYPGHNWTTENQELHANNCELFLEQSPEPADDLTPPDPEPPVPPVVREVPRCEASVITTAPDEQTVVQATVPPQALKGKSRSAKAFIKIGNVPADQASRLHALFETNIKRMLSDIQRSGRVPPGLLKKGGSVSYTPNQQQQLFIPSTTTREVVVVSSDVECPLDDSNIDDSEPGASTDADDGGATDASGTDDDSEGLPDSDEQSAQTSDTDTDGDGIPDSVDPDDDNDGIIDRNDPNPTVPDEDSDSDGIPDSQDSAPETPATDSDSDGIPDSVDQDPTVSDSDDDGIPDEDDSEPDIVSLDEDDQSVDEEEGESEVVIISDSLTDEDLQNIDAEASEIVVPPFEVTAFDENGDTIDAFSEPVLIEIFNPMVQGDSDSIFVFQPSADGLQWFEVPAERDDDTLRFYLDNPGVIAIALLPQRALAADADMADIAAFSLPGLPAIPAPIAQAFEFGGLATGGFLAFWSMLRAPFSVNNIWRMLAHGWHHLFELFAWRKRRRPWGTVYDSVTKAPVDPAYVELFDTSGEKIDEAITDLDGRYGFVVSEGRYDMHVRKTHYTFPSTRPHFGDADIIYDHLYYGGTFDAAAAVARDIPMDPLEFDWNQYEKMRTRQTRFIHRFDPIIVFIFDVVFWIGAALMFWQFFTETSLLSGTLLFVYLILLYYRLRAGKPILYGVLRKNGTLLPYAVLRVFGHDTQIATKVADATGRYAILVPPGTYTLRVEERVGKEDDRFETVYENRVTAKNGIINANLNF